MKRVFFVLSLFVAFIFAGCTTDSKDDEGAAKSQYTVTFNANNEKATGTTKTITAEGNTTITLTANAFSLEGYVFESWNTKKDGSGATYADKASIKITEDLTLYAQWKLNSKQKYTITFDGNKEGITGSTASVTSEANSTVTLTANGFSLDGYVFTGWNTAKDGSGTGYADGASIKLTENITLYAQWILSTVPTYSINISSIVANGKIMVSKTVSPAGDQIKITLTPNEFYAVESITVTGMDGSQIQTSAVQEESNAYTFIMPSQNVTVSASFEYVAHTISINSNLAENIAWVTPSQSTAIEGTEIALNIRGGAYEIDTLSIKTIDDNEIPFTEILDTSFLTSERRILCNSTTFIMPDKNVVISISFKRKIYTVSFNPNHENVTGTMPNQLFEAWQRAPIDNKFQLYRHKFKGWNTKPDGSGISVKIWFEPTQDTTLYAQWEFAKYKIQVSETGTGFLEVNCNEALEDEDIVITAKTEDYSYYPSILHYPSVVVKDSDGKTIRLEMAEKIGEHRFKMPNSDVIVSLTFKLSNPRNFDSVDSFINYLDSDDFLNNDEFVEVTAILSGEFVIDGNDDYNTLNKLFFKFYALTEWSSAPLSVWLDLSNVTNLTDFSWSGKNRYSDNCKSNLYLTRIILPNSLKKISTSSFYKSQGLTTVFIPEGVEEIGSGAFSGCSHLKAVVFQDTTNSWTMIKNGEKIKINVSATDFKLNATLLRETYAGCTWKKSK